MEKDIGKDIDKDKEIKEMTNEESLALMGPEDSFLKEIEKESQVSILARGNEWTIKGKRENRKRASRVIDDLLALYRGKKHLFITDVHYFLSDKKEEGPQQTERLNEVIYTTPHKKKIRPRTQGQVDYIRTIKDNDMVFGVGPAGTGKTFLAVVMAIRALKEKDIERIILVRPAVEAGENLGFLPGDLKEKIDPYLRPLYDALHTIVGRDTSLKLIERQIIEIAPLAYMRGRTLDDAFIILDEAQNTTEEQMKMFLTRMGFNSKVVITGDLTQVDLPRGKRSGLKQSQALFQEIKGIGFHYLTETDVVRHPLVKKIILAYEGDKAENGQL